MIKLTSLLEVNVRNPHFSYKEVQVSPDEYEITLRLFNITMVTYGYIEEGGALFSNVNVDYLDWVKFKQYLKKLKISYDFDEHIETGKHFEDSYSVEYISINKSDLK